MGNYRTYPVIKHGRVYHVTVGCREHAINEGLSFTSLDYAFLNTGEYLDLTFRVPTEHRTRFTYDIQTGFSAKAEYFKDTVQTGGTTAIGRNRNEESLNTDSVSITTGGTITTPGTLLALWEWGTSTAAPVGPNLGGNFGGCCLIWPQNVVRRFRITSNADANRVTFRSNFIMCEMIPEEL